MAPEMKQSRRVILLAVAVNRKGQRADLVGWKKRKENHYGIR